MTGRWYTTGRDGEPLFCGQPYSRAVSQAEADRDALAAMLREVLGLLSTEDDVCFSSLDLMRWRAVLDAHAPPQIRDDKRDPVGDALAKTRRNR